MQSSKASIFVFDVTIADRQEQDRYALHGGVVRSVTAGPTKFRQHHTIRDVTQLSQNASSAVRETRMLVS